MSYFKKVQELTPTRFWINNVTRRQAKMSIEKGAVGCTQNPSYVYKMLTTTDADEQKYVTDILKELIHLGTPEEVEVLLQKRLIENVAEIFMPQYEETFGKAGFVSIQGDPFKEDTDSIIKFALSNTEKFPNLMAKIPCTKEGLEAIEYLIEKRIPINVTEVMSTAQAMDTCEVYYKGIKGLKNPAPLYISHIPGIFDDYITAEVKRANIDISPDVVWEAGISVAKKVEEMVNEKYPEIGLISGGCRGVHHFTEMVGSRSCVTINWEGTADILLEQNPKIVQNFKRPVAHSVIDELCTKINTYHQAYFRNALRAEEYEEFGPVVLFRVAFEEAWKDAIDIIDNVKSKQV